MNVWVVADKKLIAPTHQNTEKYDSVSMNIEILATILALVVSKIDAGALNLNLRAFPDHVLATENEVLEEKCTGLQDDLFHPKWVFTRDDLIQANLVECKCKSVLP